MFILEVTPRSSNNKDTLLYITVNLKKIINQIFNRETASVAIIDSYNIYIYL